MVGGMSAAGLYVHFPFCRTKCPYCHFASGPGDGARIGLWRSGLEIELDGATPRRQAIDTLYVGGGTPSLMEPDMILELAARIRRLPGADLREFTLEVNPGRIDRLRLAAWKEAGVSRLSLGVQSFEDRLLRVLGRDHTASEALAFYDACRGAGFEDIGIDLMIGLPGEGRQRPAEILDNVRRLGPDHVSVYILEETAGLPIASALDADPPDEDAVAAAYEDIGRGLKELGYEHYEISNYARPGRRCLHNLKYWRSEPFIGVGPSACSRISGERWCNREDLEGWARALRAGEDPRAEVVRLDPVRLASEALIFGLRLREGVRTSDLRTRIGVDVRELFDQTIAELAAEGWLETEGDRLAIPEERWLLSNQVFSKFA
ncbi:MAG: radical SAM family heme chaperone HemW [Candidatus Aminicenantes bacterium]|nr:radical SAM family heme chaperone HemW [Candidatus Aminicenantes bacterium]